MLNKMATKLTTKLLLHKVIAEDLYDIYIYGFELLLSFAFSTAAMLMIGAIFGRILQTCAFLAVFILLRSFTGGYHAKTYWMCSAVTFSVFGAVLLLSDLVVVPAICYMILAVIGLAVMIAFVPIKHPNKTVTEAQRRRSKIISIVLFSVFITVGAFLGGVDSSLSSAVFFTLIADLLLLFIKNRKERRE